ncbi:TspO/MBR family protein [Kocuria sp.]|uniref:TspO/MBR family protein n=1 Tax=Kocuria sp. TaxID=1871328 RepID=UPI0026DCBDC0|nr:TspO/MBR family protein [Kocuria sp.]MDO4919031.1 TspO/MBR family protein [Kocuria sp.]
MSTPAQTTRTTPARGARSLLSLIPFVLIVVAVAAVGALASSNAQEVYSRLDLPFFAPPSWLFGPAWAVFYTLIAVAGWLVYRARGFSFPLSLWAVQMVLNALWTPLFFGAQLYWLAFADISLLWVAVVWCVVVFWKVRRAAAVLMLPYLAWVTFAAALNLGIALMN